MANIRAYIYSFIFSGIALASLAGYFYYKNTQETIRVLNEKLTLAEVQISSQSEQIDLLNDTIDIQGTKLNELNISMSKAEAELVRYDTIFRRHNLTRLAAAKPKMIEKRVNDGTKQVFDSIEEASDNISKLDNDRLQPLQTSPGNSNSN